MTTADANAIHLPKLDDKRRRKIGDQLQPALAELVDLTLMDMSERDGRLLRCA